MAKEARGSDLLSTIEAVHAAALDEALWPDALARIARLFNARAATLEDFEKRPMQLCYLKTAGVPPQGETAYLDHYAQNNSRAQYAFKHLSKRFLCDFEFTDERTMDRDPYYAKYLASLDLRYFLSGQIANSAERQAIVSIQRTRRQGHVERGDIERLHLLLPHVSQAYDVTKRLLTARGAAQMFEAALDRLGDGVALLRRDGRIAHANGAFQAIARNGDGLRAVHGMIEFVSAAAHTCYTAALGAVAAVAGDGDPRLHATTDFLLPRPANAPAYIVSLRPLADAQRKRHDAVAILFVRDPLGRADGVLQLLRATFGFTEAEASLARALQAGVSPSDYARGRGISLNTVYTHLRRIKDKTGCHRLPQLIQTLGNLRISAR